MTPTKIALGCFNNEQSVGLGFGDGTLKDMKPSKFSDSFD
jgi:hypothetical protein